MSQSYDIRFTKSARRALSHDLPPKIAAAVFAFITGALADNPQRVGKQLKEPLYPLFSARRGDYRVIYRILEEQIVIQSAER